MEASDHQLRFLQYNGVNKREKRKKKLRYCARISNNSNNYSRSQRAIVNNRAEW